MRYRDNTKTQFTKIQSKHDSKTNFVHNFVDFNLNDRKKRNKEFLNLEQTSRNILRKQINTEQMTPLKLKRNSLSVKNHPNEQSLSKEIRKGKSTKMISDKILLPNNPQNSKNYV